MANIHALIFSARADKHCAAVLGEKAQLNCRNPRPDSVVADPTVKVVMVRNCQINSYLG